MLRAVRERNEGPISDAEMLRLFREIMSACLAQEEPLKIAYLGPEGTFTQSAVYKQFGHSVRALSVPTIDEVFEQVQSGDSDFGVVPVENSTQGIVSHTLDMFLFSDLKICGEIELRVRQNLLTLAKSLNQVERVYSHEQSLSQCKNWLRTHLPGVELIAVSSNSEAARRVRGTPESAAIGGRSIAYPEASDLWVTLIQGPATGLPATSPVVLGARLALLAFWASRADTPEGRMAQEVARTYLEMVVEPSEWPLTASEISRAEEVCGCALELD